MEQHGQIVKMILSVKRFERSLTLRKEFDYSVYSKHIMTACFVIEQLGFLVLQHVLSVRGSALQEEPQYFPNRLQ